MPTKKTQQQIKKQQAQLQSDAIEMSSFSEGIVYGGADSSPTLDPGMDMSYSFGDLGQLDMFDEMDMKLEAIASMSGMSGIFELKGADIYTVLSISKNNL